MTSFVDDWSFLGPESILGAGAGGCSIQTTSDDILEKTVHDELLLTEVSVFFALLQQPRTSIVLPRKQASIHCVD